MADGAVRLKWEFLNGACKRWKTWSGNTGKLYIGLCAGGIGELMYVGIICSVHVAGYYNCNEVPETALQSGVTDQRLINNLLGAVRK